MAAALRRAPVNFFALDAFASRHAQCTNKNDKRSVIPFRSDPSEADDAAPLSREIGRALRAIPWVTAVLMLVLGIGMIVFSLWKRTHIAAHDAPSGHTQPL